MVRNSILPLLASVKDQRWKLSFNLYRTGTGDLNPCIMGLLAELLQG
jgi:hypothetical protein